MGPFSMIENLTKAWASSPPKRFLAQAFWQQAAFAKEKHVLARQPQISQSVDLNAESTMWGVPLLGVPLNDQF